MASASAASSVSGSAFGSSTPIIIRIWALSAWPAPTMVFFTRLGAYSATSSPACAAASRATPRAWPSFSVATASLLTKVASAAASCGANCAITRASPAWIAARREAKASRSSVSTRPQPLLALLVVEPDGALRLPHQGGLARFAEPRLQRAGDIAQPILLDVDLMTGAGRGHVVGSGFDRRIEHVVLARDLGVELDHSDAVEQERHRPGLGQMPAAFRERGAHVGRGPVAVVGEHLDDDRHAAGPIALVADLLVSVGVAALGLLDRALDVVLGHVLGAGGQDGGAQPRVHVRIGHPELRRHGDLACELREQLGARGILAPLAVHDVLELRMSGHGSFRDRRRFGEWAEQRLFVIGSLHRFIPGSTRWARSGQAAHHWLARRKSWMGAHLLAVVPDIGRELPVCSDLLPHYDILAGDFLRRWTLGLQAEGPDLARRGGPQRLDVEGYDFRIADLLRHAFPHCADRSPAFHHAGPGRKCGRVIGVERRDSFEIAFVEQFHPFRIHRLDLGLLGDGRRD